MTDSATLQFGPFRLHGRNGPLLRDAVEIKLQPKALAALWTLLRQAGEVVTKAALMDAVWPGVVVGDDALTFQVQALRRALEDDPKAPRYVLTVHRIGFRFAAAVTSGLDALAVNPPQAEAADTFVGRMIEIDSLHALLDKARQGRRQIVFVTGEAGIGKTTLVSAFLAQARRRHPAMLIGRGQCIEHQGPAEAYLPVLDALGNLLRQAADDRPIEVLKRMAPGWLLQLPALMQADEHTALKRQAQGASHARVLRELAEALEHMSLQQPVLLVLEDLHWGDTATLDLLAMLGRRSQAAQLLIVVTYRPVDAILAEHPVRAVQLRLKAARQASELLLGYLDADAVALYLQQRSGTSQVAPELIRTLHARSGGHPLFLAQIFDYLTTQGQDLSASLAILETTLPQGLRDLIALQLAQLGPDEQKVLEVASVVGMDFAAALVAACTGIPVEAVERRCDHLARQGQFIRDHGLAIWPDGTSSGRYRFRHVLYEQALLQSLASGRRARLHRQIGDQLEAAYGERSREIAGELANHYERAAAVDKTVRYCIALAGIALERTAADEVRIQTQRGLDWLASLPAGSGRDEQELALRTAAARALQAQFGNHCREAQAHLSIVEGLTASVRDPALLQPALTVLWLSAHFQGRYEAALTHATTVRNLGQALAQPQLKSAGHAWASHSLHITGRHGEAEEEALLGMQQADLALRQRPGLLAVEPGCAAQTAYALTRWYLGFPDQALQAARAACASSALIGNPYVQCLMLSNGLGNVLLFRRDWAALQAVIAEAIALSEKYGHDDGLLLATQQGLIARCMLMDGDDALPLLLAMMDRERASGCMTRNLIAGYVHAAEGALLIGQIELAQRATASAMALIDEHGRRAWEPEIWRVRAKLLIARNPDQTEEAEACLQRSLDISRERRGRSLELRAALCLARLWTADDRAPDALALIRPLFERYAEGFETADLKEAAALIDALQVQPASAPTA
ncbi:AAA family ATPase [Nevskia ramosa]|uniref:AAA family ATPase n=1 Tax=Nevskia ramosa TaxID=64002 RepID=UPI003D0F5E7D